MVRKRIKDFSIITEYPAQMGTNEQLQRLFSRYKFAKKFAIGKRVLEVGCGSGIGLGYLGEVAESVIGGDIEGKSILAAQSFYVNKRNIETIILDAENLPFERDSFDLLIIFETIYYLECPEEFLHEANRVLRDNGVLIICTVNKDWGDFHPSKYSTRYYSVPELDDMLTGLFPEVRIYGVFKVEKRGLKAKAVSSLKRAASLLGLIPGSLRAREFLKRMFIGELSPIPSEVYEGMAQYIEPIEIEKDRPTDKYKIIYVVATKAKIT